MAGSTVTMFSKSNDTHANNIGAKESWGNKKRENLFVNSFVGTSSGGISYVNSKTRSTNDVQGDIVNTGVVSDIAIEGAGMLIVSDSPTGKSVYTRRGDFRQDELGFWENGGGQILKAWKLDGDGNLPHNSSLLSTLEAVNFANTKVSPVATSVISIAMNLNADQEALRGAGVDATLNTHGLNKATQTDSILLPEPERGLTIGDSFEFKATPDGEKKTVTFGGLVAGNIASNDKRILGARNASDQFAFGNDPNTLKPGESKLIITVDGNSYTFTAVQGADGSKNQRFSSITNLASAINAVSSLKARVDEHGRLYVAPTNADKTLTFTESGNNANTSIRTSLGLVDLAASIAGVNRFNSLETLRNVVNKGQDLSSLKATIEGKNVKITSLLATGGFNISGNSLGVQKIHSAKLNPSRTEKDRATIYIPAPSHGLQVGDFIRTSAGLHANAPAGTYMVGRVDNNGFAINLTVNDSAFPALAHTGPCNIPGGATWQKTMGQKFDVQAGNIVGADVGAITIRLDAHGLVNDDVIYVDGGKLRFGAGGGGRDITLPSGYYHVKRICENSFSIVPTAVAVAGPAAAGFTDNTVGLNFRKIGTVTGGAFGGATNTFDTKVFEARGVMGDRFIRTYIPNHTYTTGDMISFKGLPDPQAVDTIPLVNGVKYKITGSTDDTVEFKVFDVNGAQVNGTNHDADVALGVLDPHNFSINNASRLFEFFGINQEKSNYDSTYEADNEDKNITSGKFASDKVFSQPLTVYDSLGSSYTLLLNFAKLANNKWAVEVAAQKDKDGIFDIKEDHLVTKNGVIRTGEIDFDENGSIITPVTGFDTPLKIQRTNGSAVSDIVIDWENALSEIKSGTVTQNKSPNNVEIVQKNGQAAGNLTKVEVSPDGFVMGTFDSGETRKLYKVPLALFANVNGLVAGSNGVFETSRKSGDVQLKAAGIGGAGSVLGGVLEASNTDSTSELIAVQELSNTIRANARVASTEFKNLQTILSELNN
jgi:flagellar hook-basal body protein